MRNILWPFWLRLGAQLAGAWLGVSLAPQHSYWWLLTGFAGCLLGGIAFDSFRKAYDKERGRK